jgi:benzoyl-CoA reductase subunit D
MGNRLLKLLRATKVTEGDVMVTGGLALDTGLVAAMVEGVEDPKNKVNVDIAGHEHSIYAGSIGAALWGAFRHKKLADLGQLKMAS